MSYTVNNYQSMIENLLYKKSKKYDLIVFDNIYSKKFESYFLDLKDLLPQEHLDLYSEGIAAQTCIFNNKWVALVIFFFFFFFLFFFFFFFLNLYLFSIFIFLYLLPFKLYIFIMLKYIILNILHFFLKLYIYINKITIKKLFNYNIY